jgi:hypothetical protein
MHKRLHSPSPSASCQAYDGLDRLKDADRGTLDDMARATWAAFTP